MLFCRALILTFSDSAQLYGHFYNLPSLWISPKGLKDRLYASSHCSFSSLTPGLPRWYSGKESACHCRRHKRQGFDPWVGKIPWRRKWQLTPIFLPGKSHGQGNLPDYSPCDYKPLNHHHQVLIINAGEGVKKKDSSCPVDATVHWYIQYGK